MELLENGSFLSFNVIEKIISRGNFVGEVENSLFESLEEEEEKELGVLEEKGKEEEKRNEDYY